MFKGEKGGGAGNAIIIILAIFLLFGVFRDPIIDGIKSWRSDPTTQTTLVTTGGGVTAANVTLSYDLFQAALAEVTSVVSNNSSDTPAATLYYEDTKNLTIGGLASGTTRLLTIGYTAETQDAAMRHLGPFMVFIILGGCVFYIFWQNKHGKRGDVR
jgi:hypothetical protein